MKILTMTALAFASSAAWAAPGAGGLLLEVSGSAIPGDTMDFVVSGAAPGQTVYIGAATSQADDLCPALLNGLCLGLASPKLVAVGPADGNGEFATSVTVPASPPGTLIYLQAAAAKNRRAPATSSVVSKLNPNTTGSLTVAFGQLLFTEGLLPLTGTGFSFFSIFSDTASVTTCDLQTSMTAAPVTSFPDCPSCDFSWELTHGSTLEAPSAGDCAAFYGFDLGSPVLNVRGLGIDLTTYGYPVAFVDYGGGGFVPYALAYWDGSVASWTYGYSGGY